MSRRAVRKCLQTNVDRKWGKIRPKRSWLDTIIVVCIDDIMDEEENQFK